MSSGYGEGFNGISSTSYRAAMLKCTLGGGTHGVRVNRVKCRALIVAIAMPWQIIRRSPATILIHLVGEARPVRQERSVHHARPSFGCTGTRTRPSLDEPRRDLRNSSGA